MNFDIVRDYEDFSNHDKETHIKSLYNVCLTFFDEMKRFPWVTALIAQDTAERVKQAAQERSNSYSSAEQDAQRLLEEAKYKAMKFSVRLQIMRKRNRLLRQKS